MYNVKETVDNLNYNFADDEFSFSHTVHRGYCEVIKLHHIRDSCILEFEVFNSEDNNLNYIESENRYEDLYRYCINRIQNLTYFLKNRFEYE